MLGTRNEHKCSSPLEGILLKVFHPTLLIMQYGGPAKKKLNPTICGQVAAPRWESNTNILLGHNSKLTQIPRDCHNNNTDTENTVS